MNIKLNYLYRDGANYKKNGEVIFSNKDSLTLDQIREAILDSLIEREFFYADKWGFPDLHYFKWDEEIDHSYHGYSGIEETEEHATNGDAKEFLVLITDIKVKTHVSHILFDDSGIRASTQGTFPNKLKNFKTLFAEPQYLAFKIIEGGKLDFNKVESEIFNRNLLLIDGCMPVLLSEILLWQYYAGSQPNMAELTIELNKTNPLHFNLSYGHPFYRFKILNFLCAVLYGMTADRQWDGQYDQINGMNLINGKGDITCCYVYNLNYFQNHLITHVKLAKQIVVKKGSYIKLSLQMDFV